MNNQQGSAQQQHTINSIQGVHGSNEPTAMSHSTSQHVQRQSQQQTSPPQPYYPSNQQQQQPQQQQQQQQTMLPTIDLNAILGIPRAQDYSNHQGGFHYNNNNSGNSTQQQSNPSQGHSSHHALHYALVSSNTPSHHVQHNYHQLPGIPSSTPAATNSSVPPTTNSQPSPPQPSLGTGGQADSAYSQDVLLLVVEQQRRIYHLEEELQRSHEYISKLQTYAKNLEIEKEKHHKKQSRYWTQIEHQKFLEAIEKFGRKDVKSIAQYVGTRNATQVRTHAQKYYAKIEREMKKQREQQLAGVYKNTDDEGKLLSRKKRKRESSDNSSSNENDTIAGTDHVSLSFDEDDDDEDDVFDDDMQPDQNASYGGPEDQRNQLSVQ